MCDCPCCCCFAADAEAAAAAPASGVSANTLSKVIEVGDLCVSNRGVGPLAHVEDDADADASEVSDHDEEDTDSVSED